MSGHARIRRVVRQALLTALGGLVGATALYVAHVRRGPALEPWHTVRLAEEFSVRSSGVSELNGYLSLEDRLFAELDRTVYGVTDTGPAYRLARFSTGSLPDPRPRRPNWNRTFELVSSHPVGGVLLLHGMSDSPYSLRALGQSMHGAGLYVVGLRLPGHGTAPSGLRSVRWEDMAAVTRMGVDHLATVTAGGPLYIIGYSTGAALAVQYALDAMEDAERPIPDGLVLVSPALDVTPLALLAKWNVRLSWLPGLEKLAWESTLPEFDPYKYGSFALNAAHQVLRLTQTVSKRIQARARSGGMDGFPPVLAFASAADATVPVEAVVDRLFSHLAPGRSELVLFDVNRAVAGTTVLVSDPGPLATRMLTGDATPFRATVLTNGPDPDDGLVLHRRVPGGDATSVTTSLRWPPGVFSLSHVALPFPADDPLYGAVPPESERLYLGQLPIQGERGVLAFPADWLLRLRHNPFWDYMNERTLDWIASGAAADVGPGA